MISKRTKIIHEHVHRKQHSSTTHTFNEINYNKSKMLDNMYKWSLFVLLSCNCCVCCSEFVLLLLLLLYFYAASTHKNKNKDIGNESRGREKNKNKQTNEQKQ